MSPGSSFPLFEGLGHVSQRDREDVNRGAFLASELGSTHFSAFLADPCKGSSPGVWQLLSWARSWEAGCEPPGNSQWSERGLPESAGVLGPPVCRD